MPAPELIGRIHQAVLWRVRGRDAYGRPRLDTDNPEELLVRWDDTYSERIDKDGSTVAIDAEVVLDQAVTIDSLLWRGGLDDLPGTGYLPESNVMVVKFVARQDDLKGRCTAHSASLMKYQDTLPSGRV